MLTCLLIIYINSKNKYRILFKKKWQNDMKVQEVEDKYLKAMNQTILYLQFKINKRNNK